MERALGARVCSLLPSPGLCTKCRFHASRVAREEGAAAARKKAEFRLSRPKLGRWIQARYKTGQDAANLLGEPPVEIPRVEELLRSLMQGLPPGLASGAGTLREDLENNFRAVLRANLGKLDLAGRDEFDAQRKVLERTRARLEALEQRVTELEARSNAGR